MAVEVHVADTGTVVQYEIKDYDPITETYKLVDLGTSITRELVIQNSGAGTRQVLAGTLLTDGSDGIVEFVSEFPTWDTAGVSREQVNLEFSASEAWSTDIVQRQVGCKL